MVGFEGGLNGKEAVITQQSRLDPKQVEQFRAIYVDSFPASERADFDELVNDIANGTRPLFTATVGKNLVGFAVTLHLAPTDIYVLEYLAVEQASRNRGIGEKLLRRAGEVLRVNSHASAIILEVESEDEGKAEERQLRVRRIEFYRRIGAKMVDCARGYRAPNLAGPGTVPYRLMWLALAEQAVVPTGTRLKDCITALYIQSYGLSPDDPLIASTLKGLTC
jgi:ribosomal protein S18 acetylase RimI-like enzyme